MDHVGCFFAQGVQLQPDNLSVDFAKPENSRGFVPAPYTRERNYPNTMTIEFLETNLSFVDFVIRPWVILASHYGFVARNSGDSRERAKNVMCPQIIIQEFTRSMENQKMIARKIWRMFNCCPMEIGNRAMTQDTEGFTQGRNIMDTKWVYSHYTVESNLYTPSGQIIINSTSLANTGNKQSLNTKTGSLTPRPSIQYSPGSQVSVTQYLLPTGGL